MNVVKLYVKGTPDMSYLFDSETLQFILGYLIFYTKQFTVQDLYLRPLIFWIQIMKNFHYLVRQFLYDVE